MGVFAGVGLAGCSEQDNESIRIGVLSSRDSTTQVEISIRSDASTAFSQQLVVPPNTSSDDALTTTFDSGFSTGTELTAEVTAGDENMTVPFELGCGSEFEGNLLTVKIQENGLFVGETASGSSCYG
jgi:hypothetical protein